MNKQNVIGRVRSLEQRAQALRQHANKTKEPENNNTLWMSSLDIIGELLSVVEEIVANKDDATDSMQLACPNCQSVVSVSYDAVAEAAANCPVCGMTVLLANPT